MTPDGFAPLNYPILQTTNVVSNVNVRDGDTIVIGGGVDNTTDEDIVEVPLLADIPLIGQFFRRRQVRVVETENLIFVTPRIVKEEPVPATLGPI